MQCSIDVYIVEDLITPGVAYVQEAFFAVWEMFWPSVVRTWILLWDTMASTTLTLSNWKWTKLKAIRPVFILEGVIRQSKNKRVLANTHALRLTLGSEETKKVLIYIIIFLSELEPLQTDGRHQKQQQAHVKFDTHVVKESRLQEKMLRWLKAFCIFLCCVILVFSIFL